MGMANSRELGHLKSELGSVGVREREWEERCGQLKEQVERLQRDNDTLREQHLTQVCTYTCMSLSVWNHLIED